VERRFHLTSRNAKNRNQETKERKLKIVNSVRRLIAEALFADLLDEDYNLGIRYAREVVTEAHIQRLEYLLTESNKTDSKGVQKAIDSLKVYQS
jgi:hypothetical protein